MSSDMSFCSKCGNLMVPREDTEKRSLFFVCRQCGYSEATDPLINPGKNCVDRLNFNFSSKEDILVSKDLAKDPTLGRTSERICVKCHGNVFVFFQIPERLSDGAMKLGFVCCNEACGDVVKEGIEDHSGKKSTLKEGLLESHAMLTNFMEYGQTIGEGKIELSPIGGEINFDDGEAGGLLLDTEKEEYIDDSALFGE